MEGDSLVLFFVLSGSAVTLLFLVALWQQQRITRLNQDLDSASLALAKQRDTGTGHIVPILETAPFAVCYADNRGSILSSSHAFSRLAGKRVKTLEDFAQATGVYLASNSKKQRHERVVMKSKGEEGLRHFSLVSWPILGKHSTQGMVFALMEHTSAVRHSAQSHAFIQEVFSLQAELLKNIQSDSTNTALTEEIEQLTKLIHEQSSPHPHKTHETFNLVDAVKPALDTYRGHFRKRNISIMSTLPQTQLVHGYAEEAAAALELLLAAVAEHAPEFSSVRLHMGQRGNKAILAISLPDMRNQRSLESLFSFGSKAIRRQSQVRLALARLLLGHQRSNLTLTVDEEGAAVAEVSFVKGAA